MGAEWAERVMHIFKEVVQKAEIELEIDWEEGDRGEGAVHSNLVTFLGQLPVKALACHSGLPLFLVDLMRQPVRRLKEVIWLFADLETFTYTDRSVKFRHLASILAMLKNRGASASIDATELPLLPKRLASLQLPGWAQNFDAATEIFVLMGHPPRFM